jgi:hypothetical protein
MMLSAIDFEAWRDSKHCFLCFLAVTIASKSSEIWALLLLLDVLDTLHYS